MKAKETMKRSSCNKSKLVDNHSGTNFPIIDTSYELYSKGYFSEVNFEGNCQKKSKKTVSGSSPNKHMSLNGVDMSKADPSVKLENLNEDGMFVLHDDVQNGDHVLPDSTSYEVGSTSNGPSDFQRKILDYLSSIDDSQIEPSYKRYLECLSKDENAFMHDVPSEDHVLPSSDNLNGHDLVCTTDERGRVLYIEPFDTKAYKNNQGDHITRCGGYSWFDEKLSVVLSQPYDENEYEKLWRDVTKRKCVNKQRQLRSKPKGYVSEKVGRSYLDYYPDLAVKLESAGRDERLSLLRQFFFWLENSCHEEAYKPWTHKSLACVPIPADEYEPVQELEVPKVEEAHA
ncbi:unnamed protein product [Urochloa humidicola]